MADPKTILAKFPGTCAECGQRFPAGSSILWMPGKAKHVDCVAVAGSQPAPKPVGDLERILPSPCQVCGRRVAKLSRAGKARYSHMCPHGRKCPASGPLAAHVNGPRPVALGGCPECAQAELDAR